VGVGFQRQEALGRLDQGETLSSIARICRLKLRPGAEVILCRDAAASVCSSQLG
jgi:hypothetical protein